MPLFKRGINLEELIKNIAHGASRVNNIEAKIFG
jgi:hypothetical protein